MASWSGRVSCPPPRPRRKNSRNPWIIAGSVAAVVVVAVIAIVLANTADSGNNPKVAKKNTPATTVPKSNTLTLVVGKIAVQSAGPPAKLAPAVRNTVMHSTQLYVNEAILAPLERGQVNNAYANVFDPGVKPAAARTDHAVLTEATTGPAHGAVIAKASPVRIDVLGDPTGKVALVAATFTMNINAPMASGRLVIRRRTEFTFADEFGKWVVTGYRVSVRRGSGAKTASKTITSTASSGTSGVSS